MKWDENCAKKLTCSTKKLNEKFYKKLINYFRKQ